MLMQDVMKWSSEEFGGALLGNTARTRRLVKIAEGAANRPSGKVSEIFDCSADREGAYKFLENELIASDAIARSAHLACALRCSRESFVFVPVDGSSLSFLDDDKIKGLGSVGNRTNEGRGLQVMSAIAVTPDGTPVGMCGQKYWTRSDERAKGSAMQIKWKRSLSEKETKYWLETIDQVQSAFNTSAPGCVPWYQLDRGGDFKELLLWAQTAEAMVTVRAAWNRRVKDGDAKYLWESLLKKNLLGTYQIDILAGQNREARTARMEVRGSSVKIELRNRWNNTSRLVDLYAVLVQECGTTPLSEKPIEWLLLTNREIQTYEDACLVIFGYAQRWRIEEFHKTWKSTCRIEDSQLRDAERIITMAVILSSVAMRIQRLTYYARKKPDEPATVELTHSEIKALIIMKKLNGYKNGEIPTISIAVRWIADLGGYTGKSSGGPPGATVIGRGLRRLQEVADVIDTLSKQN